MGPASAHRRSASPPRRRAPSPGLSYDDTEAHDAIVDGAELDALGDLTSPRPQASPLLEQARKDAYRLRHELDYPDAFAQEQSQAAALRSAEIGRDLDELFRDGLADMTGADLVCLCSDTAFAHRFRRSSASSSSRIITPRSHANTAISTRSRTSVLPDRAVLCCADAARATPT